jgi:hypothetical protein
MALCVINFCLATMVFYQRILLNFLELKIPAYAIQQT